MIIFSVIIVEESNCNAPTPVVIVALIIFAVLAWAAIRWYIEPGSPEQRKEAMSLFFQTLGGIAFLVGVYFTWQQLITSREELRTTQQGQITERFTRAIDQIGKADEGEANSQKNLAIRLGGIYALERIARDSKTDHPAIMEVLTAFIRQNAPWTMDKESGQNTGSYVQPDTQAAMTVIGRREVAYQNVETQRLNLSGTDLRGADLKNARLSGADMRSTHFEEALLNGVQLNDAILADARFHRATLDGANLRGADLQAADFREASLHGVDFTGADLRKADLQGAVGLTQQQINSAKTDAETNTGK